ncbi:hypothetical protein X801_00208 [Opisthorchis viverrini]|uniref:Uncharacterized protein n=1 Tax=Opisthorchis viverrini TaxID=6198 RepID=A0A1S8XAX3_OPIVI|nr:hypothetical protein X801_00208 [Opisthorchis viverrini]
MRKLSEKTNAPKLKPKSASRCVCLASALFCKKVDELLRTELRNLKISIDKEKLRRVAKKKGRKGRKGKKGRRGRKQKDLTPDRTLISLYEELVLADIIKKVKKTQLSDFLGEYSFLGTTLRQANIEPQPSLSDVRRLLTEYAILPLGKTF